MQTQSIKLPDWTLARIPLHAVDSSRIREREDLFYMVTAASFIEIAADLYTRNLVSYFADDIEVSDWLRENWEPDELRHGRALRAYVLHVWPEFDWDRAYREFFEDYSRLCKVEEFEATRGLELVARCVIEMGTATYYHSLADNSVEPILAGIARRIRADEINHYKHFYRYFRRYKLIERQGRFNILGAIARRVLEARQDDVECALRHAHAVRDPFARADDVDFRALRERIGAQVRRHYPVDMAVKMLLKPLDLPPAVTRLSHAPASWLMGRFLLH